MQANIKDCQNSCLPRSKYTAYEARKQQENILDKALQRYARFGLKFSYKPPLLIQEIRERPSYTWQEVMSMIGGSLGLTSVTSILSILDVLFVAFVYLISNFINRFRQ